MGVFFGEPLKLQVGLIDENKGNSLVLKYASLKIKYTICLIALIIVTIIAITEFLYILLKPCLPWN